MSGLTLNLDKVHLSDEQFYQLCQNNRDLNFERTARGAPYSKFTLSKAVERSYLRLG